MTNQWNISTIGKFVESKQCDPTEYNRLCVEDPTARLWFAVRKAEESYRTAKLARQELGVSGISIDEARTAELEAAMTRALETRQKAMAGLESACAILGGRQEPTTRAVQGRIAFLRRQASSRHPEYGIEAGSLESEIASLEKIAQDAGV